jgi:23S rRNA pseudouridine1911/1915/1917 synthase
VIEEVVPAALAGERVDRSVSMITGCSRNEAAGLVADGHVSRNGRPVRKASQRLAEGDTVRIDVSGLGRTIEVLPDPTVDVAVIFEDDHVIVVDKQADLVVHPGAGTPTGTLVNGLLARFPELAGVGEPERPGIVHRLDKDTTGLLVIARTEAARSALSSQLEARTAHRRYLAVVCGHLEADQGLIDAAIGRSKRQPTRMAVVADGREARTRYEVIGRHDEPIELTTMHCRLETGRTHQIRVHCQAIGHAVLGDDTYGGYRAQVPFPRPALHAAELGFEHPASGEQVRFEAPPPEDLARLLDELR